MAPLTATNSLTTTFDTKFSGPVDDYANLVFRGINVVCKPEPPLRAEEWIQDVSAIKSTVQSVVSRSRNDQVRALVDHFRPRNWHRIPPQEDGKMIWCPIIDPSGYPFVWLGQNIRLGHEDGTTSVEVERKIGRFSESKRFMVSPEQADITASCIAINWNCLNWESYKNSIVGAIGSQLPYSAFRISPDLPEHDIALLTNHFPEQRFITSMESLLGKSLKEIQNQLQGNGFTDESGWSSFQGDSHYFVNMHNRLKIGDISVCQRFLSYQGLGAFSFINSVVETVENVNHATVTTIDFWPSGNHEFERLKSPTDNDAEQALSSITMSKVQAYSISRA